MSEKKGEDASPYTEMSESIERAIGNTMFYIEKQPSREASLVKTKLEEAQLWCKAIQGEGKVEDMTFVDFELPKGPVDEE